MRSAITTSSMTRRALGKLAAGAVVAGAALMQVIDVAARSLESEPKMFTMYAFYPIENGKLAACMACYSHAENKRFASREAAEANRAHPGCNCAMLAIQVSANVFDRMFGGSGDAVERTVYDKRWSSGQ